MSSPPAAHEKAWAGDVSLKLGRPILRHVYVQIDSHDTALVVRECLFHVPVVASKVKRNSAAIRAEVEPALSLSKETMEGMDGEN